jgi:hypothetical protein
MYKKLLILAILFTLCFLVVGNVSAQTPAVGVKEGDVFVYDVSDSILGHSTTEVTVESVSGSKIGFSQGTTYANGTVSGPDSFDADVSVMPGAPFNPSGSLYFFFANLNVNDPVYPKFPKTEIEVDKTVSRSYESGVRETNYMQYDDAYFFGEGTVAQVYFDKQEGVAVEISLGRIVADTLYTAHLQLKSSSVWVVPVPEFPTMLILSVLIIATSLIAVVAKKRGILLK